MSTHRVLVTGIGAVTPLGPTMTTTWDRLLEGRSGIDRLQGIPADDLRVRIGGEVADFDPGLHLSHADLRRHDPYAWYGIAAAEEALLTSGCLRDGAMGIDQATTGVTTATGYGASKLNQDGTRVLDANGPRAVSPYLAVYGSPDVLGAHISIAHGLRGASYALSAACAMGAIALGEAMRAIRHGYLSAVLVVGAEHPLNRQDISATANTRALTAEWNDDPSRASRPFDRRRSGFVMSSGATAMLLESEESARRHGRVGIAELAGYGVTTDAHHMTAPEPTGAGAVAAMRAALADGGESPDGIDHVNAHGTSTQMNDATELGAIREVFGPRATRLPITATKSMTGHLLGATGVLEAAIAALTVNRGVIPPTINLEDNEFPDYDIVTTTRRQEVRAVLSNSFGFGGHNASLLLRAVG
ncbi:beta-ketoacyl-[acyl-carrier-protein] synthase family protein [Clavibacter michiganensis subsp. michiganensis]|uniref:beta-ketoacyl-[acyl-carrier-protein] synthase family protein n=1 Tax=Clavibacter michiganensis TaxID=28447 RepID=UPI0013660765|nr:beta-ketoacyl-[acyl-carrier-protein] synthase family protein [Clavibacter michiganensis]MWJ68789.1 beta-ketoacyl-[acyl-carrier-protein] synthase family protein [Clavibacter michiganensis subsp. michiganensis]